MTRDQALAFLLSRLDYERAPLPYGEQTLKLARMRELLDRLGNPHLRYPVVHVAGTKGKGSTSAMLAAILSAAGYRTGLYTSPHLERVEERIAIDGVECSGAEFAGLVARLAPMALEMDAQADGDPEGRPTFFEVVTALAMLHFADRQVGVAVLEVGLGGRLDSTNVCQPAVGIITSISFDHTQQLGNTLAAIAREKAGILKPGMAAVIGAAEDEPRQSIEAVAREVGARLLLPGTDYTFAYRAPGDGRTQGGARADFRCRTASGWHEWRDVPLGLVGRHQAANAALAVTAVVELRRQGWKIDDNALLSGLARVRWPARVEVIAQRPTVVLDSAHNRASIQALVATLDESFAHSKRRVAVVAVSRDKDLAGMLEVLLPSFQHILFTRYWSNPRSVSPEDLQALGEKVARTLGRPVATMQCAKIEDVPAAVAAATGPDDLVCITGSIFIAGELRSAFAQ